MYSNKSLLKEIQDILINKFGEVEDTISYDFNFTDYYEEEMGKNLKKDIIVFKQEIQTKQLAGIKEYTNQLENKYRAEEKRRINIDPGYLTKEELILASNKKSPYKIEISDNIYAHLTLKFENNKCRITYRTYPDFKMEKIQRFLLKIKN